MLELINVKKVYKEKNKDRVIALDNVNVKFDDKGLYFILGKSGCGKTTLLNILAGFDSISKGKYLINGNDFEFLTEKEKDSFRNSYIGVVFQDYNLLERETVLYNISLPYIISKRKIDESKVDDILEKLDILELKDRRVNELSGGQAQRVAIARCLLSDTKIILADEPTGALDSKNSNELYKLLKEISKERLVIVVSHDLEGANNYADHLLRIENGILEYSEDCETSENFKLKNKKDISFIESFKLGIKLLFTKKLKFILTCFISILFISLLLLMFSFYNVDLIECYVDTVESSESKFIAIYKGEVNKDHIGNFSWKEITLNDYDKICTIDSNCIPVYTYIFNNSFSLDNDYYSYEYDSELFDYFGFSLLYGNYPNNGNECILSTSLCDYRNYDYNEIIGESITISDIDFKITGVYKDYFTEDYINSEYNNQEYKEYFLYKSLMFNKTNSNIELSDNFYISNVILLTKYDIRNFTKTFMNNTKLYNLDKIEDISLEYENNGYMVIDDNLINDIIVNYSKLKDVFFIILIISLILIMFSILFSIRFISYNILDRENDIGIIKSFGASKKDVFKIVNSYNIILGILNFIFGLIMYCIAYNLYNSLISVYSYIKYLNINFINMMVLFILSFGLPILSSLIPIIKFNKKEVRQLIKENN